MREALLETVESLWRPAGTAGAEHYYKLRELKNAPLSQKVVGLTYMLASCGTIVHTITRTTGWTKKWFLIRYIILLGLWGRLSFLCKRDQAWLWPFRELDHESYRLRRLAPRHSGMLDHNLDKRRWAFFITKLYLLIFLINCSCSRPSHLQEDHQEVRELGAGRAYN